jgi:hypothetical protein
MFRRKRLPPRRVRSSRKLLLEELENRLIPAALSVGPFDFAMAAVSFDATSGALTLHGGAVGSSAQVAILGNGDVALTLNGQAYSSDPAAGAPARRLSNKSA